MGEFNIFSIEGEGRFVLVEKGNAENSLLVGDAQELAALSDRLLAWRKSLATDGYLPADTLIDPWIQTVDARVLATEKYGLDVDSTTITQACVRGNLKGARKPSTRWEFRRSAFEDWLLRWKDRTQG